MNLFFFDLIKLSPFIPEFYILYDCNLHIIMKIKLDILFFLFGIYNRFFTTFKKKVAKMRRVENCSNKTIDAFDQEKTYAYHVLKLQKVKPGVNNARPIVPAHLQLHYLYKDELRVDVMKQGNFLSSLIPTKSNPHPVSPKARDFQEICHMSNPLPTFGNNSRRAKTRMSTPNKKRNQEFFVTQTTPIGQQDAKQSNHTGIRLPNIFDKDYDKSNNLNKYEHEEIKKNETKRVDMLRKSAQSTFNSRFYKMGIALQSKKENRDN